jgi:predicted DCC family thiol-disulfide oxidoreductase YuxK/uncharacterized membrane protein YphA (DoxX/SURF4 family)
MNFWESFKKSLGLDYRSLALYRCLMGLIVIADVLYRLPDLTNFYTDVGLIPRSIFMSEMGMPWSLSFHFANGSKGFALAMFGVHFLFGLMLVFGYKTRWAMFGAYLMTLSVHNRNWLVNNGGDDILRAILFISIFLPLNRCFSLDSALKRDKTPSQKDYHLSTFGLTFFLQVFCIYYVSYILKNHAIWRTDFTAVFYASRLDIFASPIGIWFRQFPLLQKGITFFTIYLEFIGPLLLVFAGIFGRFYWVARLLVIAGFWGLHAGIILTMLIGVFPYTCLVMWLIFIPGEVWDFFLRRFRHRGLGKLSIFYDGDCLFCEKGVRILREFFLLPEVEIRPAASDKAVHQDMVRENSWVVVNGAKEKFFHFAALTEVLRHSTFLRLWVPLFQIRFIAALGDRLYKWVANHRQLMSRFSQFLEFQTEKKSLRPFHWLYQAAGCVLFLTLFFWNLTTIKSWEVRAPFWQNVTRWLHLYQEWNMFAPFPKMDNIWVEIPATLSDGSQIELLSGSRDVFSVKKNVFPGNVPNEHWRKFYLNLSERTDYARYYGGFLCRQWNERKERLVPETTLRKFEIIVYSQTNFIDGATGPINRKLSWKHWCFDEDYRRENQK